MYCFIWHEGIGGRGANQIASCVYYFVLNCIPSIIKHLIFYSDYCLGQNKNFHVVNLFLLAVRNNPNVETINYPQLFLFPNVRIWIVILTTLRLKRQRRKHKWKFITQEAGINSLGLAIKNALTVIKMHADLFLDFASLPKGPFQQKKYLMRTNKSSTYRVLRFLCIIKRNSRSLTTKLTKMMISGTRYAFFEDGENPHYLVYLKRKAYLVAMMDHCPFPEKKNEI